MSKMGWTVEERKLYGTGISVPICDGRNGEMGRVQINKFMIHGCRSGETIALYAIDPINRIFYVNEIQSERPPTHRPDYEELTRVQDEKIDRLHDRISTLCNTLNEKETMLDACTESLSAKLDVIDAQRERIYECEMENDILTKENSNLTDYLEQARAQVRELSGKIHEEDTKSCELEMLRERHANQAGTIRKLMDRLRVYTCEIELLKEDMDRIRELSGAGSGGA